MHARTWLVGLGMLVSALAPASAAPAAVASIAELEKTAPGAEATVQLLGYRTPGDGGGGMFFWDGKSSAAPDHCVVFPAPGSGRWIRLDQGGDLTVEQCGADRHGGQPTATRQAFQYAVDAVLRSESPGATIRFTGALYAFDGVPVTAAARYLCPRLMGGGTGTVIRLSSQGAQPAFRFSAASGARCGGGITGVTIAGNGIGVALNGATGTTVHITMGAGLRIGALLCNCATGQFTEYNDIRVDSDGLTPDQQTIVLQVSGGNDSFAGNRLGGYVSLASGARGKPVIAIGAGVYWYNGIWDMNVHNIGGGGAALLLANASANCVKASAGTLQIETTNQAPINIASGCVYYGGTIYALGANNCLGVLYDPLLILARYTAVGPNGVQEAHGADQYCLTQTFSGGSVTLNRHQLMQRTVTYSVIVGSADNSYSQAVSFTLARDPSGPGACSVMSRSVWAPTLDSRGWGTPEVSCSGGRAVISNPRWPPGMRFTAHYDVHAQ